MKKIIYRQDPLLTHETLVLEERQLIVVRGAIGLKNERSIQLSEMSPEFELSGKRFYIPSAVAGLLFIAMLGVLFWLIGQRGIIQATAAGCAFFLALVFLWRAINDLHPVEVSIVKNRDGDTLLEIFQPRKRAWAYAEFIAALSERIRFQQRGGRRSLDD